MITRLTAIKEFWTYHQITIIDQGELVTLSISNAELEKIQKRAARQKLYRRSASLFARLIMALRIIIGR